MGSSSLNLAYGVLSIPSLLWPASTLPTCCIVGRSCVIR